MIQQTTLHLIEEFARHHMEGGEPGHDFKHADRVRCHALAIARREGYAHHDRLEAAALLHDVGLRSSPKRSAHGEIGAQMAGQFLRAARLFPDAVIDEITGAIRLHCSVEADSSPLLAILRDADMLEMFGAIGILRGVTSKASQPEYDPLNPRGDTWALSAEDFNRRFASGIGVGPTIVDQLNFQLSCFDNLNTETARQMARPRVAYLRGFLEALIDELPEERR